MTAGPQLRLGKALVPGVLAVVLFGLLAAVTLNTGFGQMTGFDTDLGITANIGYAMFDMEVLQEIPSEPFLVSFLLAAVVLDAALDAALVLAKREEGGEMVTALSSTRTGTDAGTDSSTDAGSSGPAATDGGEQA
ncbi:hypothetical protein [Natronobiforma cellulositropha]|uniref:hypothetical protein n=1 Tax=Natronobiforma cellulositropha TaxID=1679076 RepID=UPI0021D5FB6B|nr:hypothetical protein [Natronobiforma cellulositropha]